jgi:hypothetical protein
VNIPNADVAWRKGVRFRSDPVQVLEVIEELNVAHGGYAPDGALVEVARDPQNFLHSDFEWDDSVAGEKYRLMTEKNMKRNLVFISHSTVPDAPPKTIRVLQRTTIDTPQGSQKVWMSTVDMLADPEGRDKILKTAKRELDSFVKKYEDLSELADILSPIKKFLGN